jgi:hypothetical protein
MNRHAEENSAFFFFETPFETAVAPPSSIFRYLLVERFRSNKQQS